MTLLDLQRLEALKESDPKAYEEAQKALEELAYLQEAHPLAFYNHPSLGVYHERQIILHGIEAKVRMFLGGNQSGKTTWGLVDDLIQALPRDVVPEHLREFKRFDPPFLCRIFAPTDAQLETVTYPKLQEYIPTSELVGEKWERAFDSELRILHFKDGSRFFFNTYKQEVSALQGSTLDRAHYDEEPPQTHRNESRMRVVRRGGDEIFTMTPTEGLTWTFEEFWEPLKDEETAPGIHRAVFHDAEYDVEIPVAAVTVDMDDNPTLTAENKAAVLQGLSKEERAARKSGKFVALHGTIYPEFRKERFRIPEFEPDDLPDPINVVVGIDPGFRGAAAVLWAFVTPQDLMTIFHEGYYHRMNVSQVAKEIHAINSYYGLKPNYYVMDPAARNKEHITGRSVQMEYANHQIVAIAGQNDVRAGINAVKERMERELDPDMDGGFQITANCDNLLSELAKYRWKKPSRIVEGDPPEKPVKKDDHAADALRYIVMSRPYLPILEEQSNETELEKALRLSIERNQKQTQGLAQVGI